MFFVSKTFFINLMIAIGSANKQNIKSFKILKLFKDTFTYKRSKYA